MKTSAGVTLATAGSLLATDTVTPPCGAALLNCTRKTLLSSSFITRSAEGSVLRLMASTRNAACAG
ncbi:hypothetical protein DR66_5147 [Delftia acidovorans]|nr:hypothetical protein DR66_5147 [Delftia acidovorans]